MGIIGGSIIGLLKGNTNTRSLGYGSYEVKSGKLTPGFENLKP